MFRVKNKIVFRVIPFHNLAQVFHWWEKLLAAKSKKPAAALAGSEGGAAGGLSLLRTLDDLKDQAAVPTWKRPNPKQRKKLKAKRVSEAEV